MEKKTHVGILKYSKNSRGCKKSQSLYGKKVSPYILPLPLLHPRLKNSQEKYKI